MLKTPFDMHLIMNTHWDREFRWSFRETQVRLMEAGDILVDAMEQDPRFKYFHPDSQSSFLDDYLELRPANRERVAKLVREGRILPGPWYTLPAAFLVSGEALVRNLLTGHRQARELGGVMKCAYNIFSWGQVSQLPQIYRQFGMDTILFYRGIDQSNRDGLEFWWEAPDGTRALGLTFGEYHRLNFWAFVYKPYLAGPPSGRSELEDIRAVGGYPVKWKGPDDFAIDQPCHCDLSCALEGLQELIDSVKDKSSTRQLGFFQGFDLENPDPRVMDLVDRLNEHLEGGRIEVSSLPDYVQAVRDELEANGTLDALDTLSGEMLAVERSGDPFAPLYAGVFSARMPLKQQNSHCQRLLENLAEPAAVFGSMNGAEYPRIVLQKAWKRLLQNQQHDGIGGVHIDRVTRAMEERYRDVEDICETVAGRAFRHLVSRIDYSSVQEREIGLTIFNTTGHMRSEVVKVQVDIPVEWGLSRTPGLPYQNDLSVEVFDPDGRPVPHQVLHREDAIKCAYLKFGSHINYEASRLALALEMGDVPPFGYVTFRIRPLIRADRPVDGLSPAFGLLENEHLRAEIQPDGTVELLHKATGAVYRDLHVFEDSGEKGGPLIHDPPQVGGVYRSRGGPVNVACETNGTLLAEYLIEYEWKLPASIESELKVRVPNGPELTEHGTLRRGGEQRTLRIRTCIALRRSSPVLEFDTTIDNTVRDHRLRVLFPTGLNEATHAAADSAFDIASRPIAVPDSTGWYEAALRTWPVQSFVDVNHGGRGLAVLHEGLSEYEVTDDADRAIALTLLRCFGTAGAPFETYAPQPLAQCPGIQCFRYGLFPHAGDVLEGRVPREARCFTVPLEAATAWAHGGDLPVAASFIQPDNERFLITCVKQAEEGHALILRGFNPEQEPLNVRFALARPAGRVVKVTLEERELDELTVEDAHAFTINAAPGEIYTVSIHLEDTP